MELGTLREIVTAMRALPGELDPACAESMVSGVSTDTRTIRSGEVFFALRGAHFDGAAFVRQALDAGALAVVAPHDAGMLPEDRRVVFVDDTLHALGRVAAWHRSRFDGRVIALTGTSGKTTVKEMLLGVLAKGFSVHGSHGNFNNQIGLPLSVMGLAEGHDMGVFELGMSAPGEIGYLAGIVRPDVALLLNVGPGHIGAFESIGAVASAKRELLPAVLPTGTVIVNGDDPQLRSVAQCTPLPLVRFGLGVGCDVRAGQVIYGADGCAQFTIDGRKVRVGIPGDHMVYNALAVYATGRVMGMDAETVCDAIEGFRAPDKRMQVIERDGVRYINDCYNANPLSMRAAASVIHRLPATRRAAVLGDMRELGTFAPAAHREIGALMAESGVERLFLVGEQAEDYRAGALTAGIDEHAISTHADAVSAAQAVEQWQQSGDVILIKGSRAIGLEAVVTTLYGER